MDALKTRIFMADVLPLTVPRQLEAAINKVSKERQEKAARLQTAAARALTVGAEMLLKKALRQVYGLDKPLAIKADADGKPALPDYPEICFNLSHSGHYVVCGLGPWPLGVDIQKMAAPNLKLARRFFAAAEADWLLSLPAEKQTRGFYDLWAIKEAYMKYTGKGFKLPMHAFTVTIPGELATNSGVAIAENGKSMAVVIKNYPDLADYVVWAVTERSDFQEKIDWIGL